MKDHHVTAVPVIKLNDVLGYRFVCSCGRLGNGYHPTAEKAIERGNDHVLVIEQDQTDLTDLTCVQCGADVWVDDDGTAYHWGGGSPESTMTSTPTTPQYPTGSRRRMTETDDMTTPITPTRGYRLMLTTKGQS